MGFLHNAHLYSTMPDKNCIIYFQVIINLYFFGIKNINISVYTQHLDGKMM